MLLSSVCETTEKNDFIIYKRFFVFVILFDNVEAMPGGVSAKHQAIGEDWKSGQGWYQR